MKAVFFHKGTEANCTRCHTRTTVTTLSTEKSLRDHILSVAFTTPTSLCPKEKMLIRSFLFAIFPHFSLHHLHPSIPPWALCCPIYPIFFMLWSDRANHSLEERKLSFHSSRLTAPSTLSMCSLILSLFQLDQIWMRSLMVRCSVDFCSHWLSEPHRERDISVQRCTNMRKQWFTHFKYNLRGCQDLLSSCHCHRGNNDDEA